jgi:hypothetical protein
VVEADTDKRARELYDDAMKIIAEVLN